MSKCSNHDSLCSVWMHLTSKVCLLAMSLVVLGLHIFACSSELHSMRSLGTFSLSLQKLLITTTVKLEFKGLIFFCGEKPVVVRVVCSVHRSLVDYLQIIGVQICKLIISILSTVLGNTAKKNPV